MVWGCFWDTGRLDLYVLDRDFELKKHGYSANSYLEVLEAQVGPQYKELEDKGYRFMQDNAAIYTAYKVRDQFTRKGIRVIDQPPYSLDLNPIEHIQWILKKLLIKNYLNLSGKGEDDIKEIEEALKHCWTLIPEETFTALRESIPRRIVAYIIVNSQYIKYQDLCIL